MTNTVKTRLTVNEMVAYLKRTSQVTALVEGKDDQKVYRYIEERLNDLDLDVLICDGRSSLLSVYHRRQEYADAPVVYIADRDMWYFTGIPSEYKDSIIFTEGYSIENDLYVKNVFETLMSEQERERFFRLITLIARWQAFHVEAFVRTGECACAANLGQFVTGDELCRQYLVSIGFIEPDATLVSRIINFYPLAIRGKTLFQGLVQILSAKPRKSKFSRDNLLELGAKTSNPQIEGLCQRTRSAVALLQPGCS